MALQSGNKSAFNYEQKQSTPTHGPPLQSMNNQTPSLNNQWKSGTSYSSTTPGGGVTTPLQTGRVGNKFNWGRKPSTFNSPKSVRPMSHIQHTMTATYAGWFNIPKRDLLDSEQKQPFKKKTKSIRIIPLSSKRGTILLSEPLKRSRITDARDRGLAKLRNDNQILQQRLEELQFENRRLQIERDQNTNEINEFEYKTKQMEKYINSLNNMLFSKMANEKIYWYSNEPIFEIKNVNYNNKHNPNHDIGMNMNLDIIEYDKNYCNIMDQKINDENNQKNQFENYLEKIIRCARIFQAQYYNTLVQKQEKEKQLITLEKQNTISIDTLNTSKTIEIETLKVQLGNVEKNFENERKIIDKKHEHSLELREKKINEFKLQLQKKNKDIEYEKKKCGEVQIKMQNIINEKRVLGIEYGKIKDTLNVREQHPILSNIHKVDNILLNYKNIQREFYIEIFDETANIHNMAFEYIRKEIKSKTSYMNRYCKQMTLKILFEIIHICWNKINKSFNEIYNKIRIHLGIYNNNKKKNNKLEEGLDFLLKYQFEEILGNLFQILIHNIIEEIYEIEFDLIKSNSGQNILTYNLHETINPMIRNKCVIDYISKICIICWKMVIFSHKNEMQNKLMFYPMHFMETQNEIRVNGEVYDKCTAHCEKKCDQILFYVFPIIIKKEYENNIFKGIKLLNNEIDYDGNEIKKQMDEKEEEEEEIKIRIKVVTRKNYSSCFSKNYTPMPTTDSKNKEEMDKLGGIKLLTKPHKIAVICEKFKSIHQQAHKNLFEALQEYFDELDDDDDDDDDEFSDDIFEMRIFKILFDILVSCYVKTVKIVNQISNDNLSSKRLIHDKRYHLLINLQHYYNELINKEENKENENKNDEREMVMKLIDNIYNKYCKLYKFLKTETKKIKQLTKTYIMKCCEWCFQFKSYSIRTENEIEEEQNEIDEFDEYGLYPLCFVRDGKHCSVINKLNEQNLDNDIINFKKVKMGKHNELCMYNDILHEKETNSNFKDITNAKICYFTWPAIVTTNKNNQYIYGNVPTQCLTKIWVLLNDEVYDMIYSDINNQE